MMYKILSVTIYVVISAFVLNLLWAVYNPETNVHFQSSDGQWHDSELLFKGREFESVVVYFELYKIKCNKPNVAIQRVTIMPKKEELAYWFNDYDEPKWKIPLSKKLPKPPYNRDSCLRQGVRPETIEMARENANVFMDKLKST